MKYAPHEIANIFPLMSGNEFRDLKADIKENGLLEPIWMYEDRILDGRNRFRACQEVGVTPDIREYTGDNPLGFVISLNLNRRHLNEAARASVAAKIANLPHGGAEYRTANLQNETTRAEAAEMLNVSERSVNTAKKVQREGGPEINAMLDTGQVSVSAAADVATLPKEEQAEIVAKGEKEILEAAKQIRAEKATAKRKERIEKIVEISSGNSELSTDKTYPVIYADPPWRYEHIETESRAIENHYPTMTLDEICELSVPAGDDAVLYLWTTSPKLEEGMRVLKEWGFSYRTCAVWDKQKMGMGYYFRQQHELLLVGARGNLPTPEPANRPRSVLSYPKDKHSAKPHAVAELIEAMYPDLSKLEMFCRSPRDGWDVWGNQSGA